MFRDIAEAYQIPIHQIGDWTLSQIWYAVADKKKQLPTKRLRSGQMIVTASSGLPEFLQLKARQKPEQETKPEAKPKIILTREEAEKRNQAVMTDLSLGGNGRINFDNPKWERAFWRSVRQRRRARGK